MDINLAAVEAITRLTDELSEDLGLQKELAAIEKARLERAAILKAASDTAKELAQRFARAHAILRRAAWSS